MAAAERVFRLLDAPSEPDDAPEAIEAENVRGEMRFSNVRFSYDGKADIIKNLSFAALPGQTVAIVGPTGRVKPPFVNLMMRFYDPQGGRIELDGRDIREYTRKKPARSVYNGIAGYMAV